MLKYKGDIGGYILEDDKIKNVSFFGQVGDYCKEKNTLEYFFFRSDFREIKSKIESYFSLLGVYKNKLDFYKKNTITGIIFLKKLVLNFKMEKEKARKLLDLYLKLELGLKINKKLANDDECVFSIQLKD